MVSIHFKPKKVLKILKTVCPNKSKRVCVQQNTHHIIQMISPKFKARRLGNSWL